MTDNINKHPCIILNQDIQTICHPLIKLKIDYFSHVLVTPDGKFSSIASNAGFAEHYLKNQYYNVDFHLAKLESPEFIIWDMIDLYGKTAQCNQEAAGFGIKHIFTIRENNEDGQHYFHFASSSTSMAINQTYLANFELLKVFIQYFKEKMNASKELKKAHEIKFQIASSVKACEIITDTYGISEVDRQDFLKSLEVSPDIVFQKNNQFIKLTPQQSKCMNLLAVGHSNKQIAMNLGLSIRTVEHYLDRIRQLVGCRSSKELIMFYHSSKVYPC